MRTEKECPPPPTSKIMFGFATAVNSQSEVSKLHITWEIRASESTTPIPLIYNILVYYIILCSMICLSYYLVPTLRVQEDVGRFEVTMDDTSTMQVLQSLQTLAVQSPHFNLNSGSSYLVVYMATVCRVSLHLFETVRCVPQVTCTVMRNG